MTPDQEPEAPIPGVPFEKWVCVCSECNRLVTAQESVARGCGPRCWARARAKILARRDKRQLEMPWLEAETDAEATA